MIDRVTLATSTGVAWASLAVHVGTGLVAIVAGFLAIAATKGGRLHRRGGIVFVYTMIASMIVATGVAAYEGKPTIFGGAFTAYLVFTAYTAVKPLRGDSRKLNVGLMILVFGIAATEYSFGFMALDRPGNNIDGVPAGMMFFMATVMLLAGVGDLRMIRAGGIHGTRRIARHLWRMCFGLFIASGSFFLGQMKFIPEPLRILPLVVGLAVAPLVVLLYWMWRVRLRQNLRGMLTAKPITEPGVAQV